MKNVLKKIVAGTAIVSTVACLSVSAFAATASVSSDKNSVTLTDWTAGSSTNQYTVVIVPADASEINENNIYYINQDNGTGMASIVNSMGVKSTLADGNYQVRIGTDVAGAAIEAFNFTVTTTPAGVKVYGYVADKEATVTLGETTVSVDADGKYSFEDVAASVINLLIKAPGAFDREMSVTVGNTDVAVSTADNKTTLVYGAVRENATKIEIDDLLSVKVAYGNASGDAGYEKACDFNRDGKVDIDDLLEIKSNYGKTISEAYSD